MARPTKTDRRDQRVNLRLTRHERKLIEARATARGQTFTTYARERVLSEAR